MTQEEQKIFLEQVRHKYYYEVYAILLLTGMRIGELSALQWNDVDFFKKEIHISKTMQTGYIDGRKILEITTPKTTNAYRTIPFFKETEPLFISWREKQKRSKKKMGERWRLDPQLGDLVFTSSVGSPLTRYVLSSDLNNEIRDINMKVIYLASREGRNPREFENLSPHGFRHTFATRCLEKGMNPLFVQRIMGHANYATTVSYTHILEDYQKNELSKITNFFD